MDNENMTTLNLEDYFEKHCFDLTRKDLIELNKQDTGALNNVLSMLATSCFGVLIYDDREILEYVVYFADNSQKLRGICLELSMKNDNQFRIQLLLEFCRMINHEFRHIDAFDAFNAYQNRLRTGFEKLGYFTIGNEIEKFKGQDAVGIVAVKKGIIRITSIDKLEMYRSCFSDTNTSCKNELNKNKVYLLFDGKNNLIKIGHSKSLQIREKTLQGENPKWDLITAWIAPQKIETELHNKYSKNRIRGEWFALTYCDLLDINEVMKPYDSIMIS